MIPSARFPEELLQQSPEERIHYFERYIARHARAEQLADDLYHAIMTPSGNSLIFVCGPPCVGKTTLFKNVMRRILHYKASLPEKDPGHIPLVAFEVPFIQARGRFEPRDYFISALTALHEPMLNKKLKEPPATLREITEGDRYAAQVHRHEQGLHWSLIQALKYRRPAAVLLDEAHHFTRVVGSIKLDAQLCWLKSMANLGKVVHVLFGTYELHQFREQSWEISRRGIEFHFSRYRGDSKSDCEEFCKVINTLQQQIPLKNPPNLVEHWRYLYGHSLGCVGHLKSWLTRGLDHALIHGGTITLDVLTKTALPDFEVQGYANTILAGEEKYLKDPNFLINNQILLGLPPLTKSVQKKSISDDNEQTELPNSPKNEQMEPPHSSVKSTKTVARQRKVGQRSPTYDQTGGVEADTKRSSNATEK